MTKYIVSHDKHVSWIFDSGVIFLQIQNKLISSFGWCNRVLIPFQIFSSRHVFHAKHIFRCCQSKALHHFPLSLIITFLAFQNSIDLNGKVLIRCNPTVQDTIFPFNLYMDLKKNIFSTHESKPATKSSKCNSCHGDCCRNLLC